MVLVETELGILLMPYDVQFVRVMEAADRISDEYAGALRKLAEGE